MKIEMTGLHVEDPVQAFKFYTEVLGFVEVMFVPEANLAIVASPEQPRGTSLLLEPSDNPLGGDYMRALYREGIAAITFSVDDIALEHDRLSKLGVVFKEDPAKTDFGSQAVFDDTCGNLIQLIELNSAQG